MLQHIIARLQRLNCSARRKVGLAFAIILVGFVANCLISIFLLYNISSTEEHQRQNTVYLQRLQRYSLAYQSELSIYSGTIFVTRANHINDGSKDVIFSSLTDSLGAGPSKADRQFESHFSNLYSIVFDHFSALETLITNNNFDEARQQWLKFQPDFDKLNQFLSSEEKRLNTASTNGTNAIATAIFLSVVTIISTTILSLLLALFMLFLIGKVLIQPLNKLQQALKQVAEGDLDQQLEILNRDEVGELAHSFKQALLSLQKVFRSVQISENLRNVTQQLAVVTQQQTVGSQDQVAALTQVRGAMQELGRTADMIASSAAQVAGLTGTTLNQIQQVAEAGQVSQQKSHQMVAVVESTLRGVERVSEQVTEFNQVMQELNVQSQAIGKIVELISSIAKEVHILALNASIEAAGAGEYGGRFQMVAREIKQLANRANRATVEANQLISHVQTTNQLALSQVCEGQNEVLLVIEANADLRQNLQALEDSAEQVERSVVSLLEFASQVRDQTDEIKQATQQQRISSQQVITSTQLVESIAEQASGSTVQIAINSVELANLADLLNGVMSQVKFAV